jgi:outer membrane protein OmpA-like peptidoglycan-associated protein
MRARRGVVTVLIALTVLPGCEYGRRYVSKPWGKGTYIPAAVCAVVGGVAGAAIESQGFTNESIRSGESCVTVGGTQTCEHDEPAYAGAAAIGAGSLAALCALVGHAVFDKEAVATPAPPPPPPTPEPVPPPSSKRIILRGVHFDFGKSDIRPDSRPVLNEAAEILEENPDVRISVEGYTDAIGSDAYNEQLSLRRAEAVFRYLVNHGISPERMDVTGYGKRHPVADNGTEAGRAQNRRVELHVLTEPRNVE